ncbi:hypothetical protein ACVIGB_001102 [Bradyrhizobium sp. USDA 4341]
MKLHRYYCKEGILAVRLHLDPSEAQSLERKLGQPILFSERFKPGHVLSALYEMSSGQLDIGPSTWMSINQKKNPLTELLRPLAMPLIEAEVAEIEKERDRSLLTEARARGWVVIERPSETLREIANRAAAGDTEAMDALERIGADGDATFAKSMI